MDYPVTYSYCLPFSILLVSSGKHSPESGRLGEQSSGLTTALFQSPLSHAVAALAMFSGLGRAGQGVLSSSTRTFQRNETSFIREVIKLVTV